MIALLLSRTTNDCVVVERTHVLGDVCLPEGSRLSLVSNKPLLNALLRRGSRDRRPLLYYNRWQHSCVAALSLARTLIAVFSIGFVGRECLLVSGAW